MLSFNGGDLVEYKNKKFKWCDGVVQNVDDVTDLCTLYNSAGDSLSVKLSAI